MECSHLLHLVSAGVVLLLVIVCSIFVVMKRKRKTVGQATAAGQCITVCDHYSTIFSALQVMMIIMKTLSNNELCSDMCVLMIHCREKPSEIGGRQTILQQVHKVH